ncbi:hypothetical protein Tco_0730443 [Tanacetum coccineum]|uniref:Uncharacterized protein n=1 Tax=Tanacetum coccineum TaxID=301880 RepID=A0ABQ4YUK3_9ASTR
MDTAYGRRWIRRIGNYEYVFSCEDLALIRRISFPGYESIWRIGVFLGGDHDKYLPESFITASEYGAQIRRIFLDGYDVLVVRTTDS